MVRTRLRKRVQLAVMKYIEESIIINSIDSLIDYKAIIEHLKPFPKEVSKYHIDHIRPLCSFDLNDIEQVKIAFAPSNHQWLLAEENIKKGGKWNGI